MRLLGWKSWLERMGEEAALDVQGTPFQIRVWDEIRKIPYGETRTYKSIAKAIGKSGSYRAVANACGSNPIPISVPCHRESVQMAFWGATVALGDLLERSFYLLQRSESRILEKLEENGKGSQ